MCVCVRAPAIVLLHMAWDVPYLRRSKKSEFIHLKGRIWTKPSTVIDEGRYGVGREGGGIRSQDDTEKSFGIESDGDKFKPSPGL